LTSDRHLVILWRFNTHGSDQGTNEEPRTREEEDTHVHTLYTIVARYRVVSHTFATPQEILRAGDGTTFPKKGDKLTMHYKYGLWNFYKNTYPSNIHLNRGTLAKDGTQFDSSYDKGRPFSFHIGRSEVIQGWDEGVMQMSLSEKAKLHITSDFGYGAQGAGGVIPPHADLEFVVELLAIGDQQAPSASTEGGCCTIA